MEWVRHEQNVQWLKLHVWLQSETFGTLGVWQQVVQVIELAKFTKSTAWPRVEVSLEVWDDKLTGEDQGSYEVRLSVQWESHSNFYLNRRSSRAPGKYKKCKDKLQVESIHYWMKQPQGTVWQQPSAHLQPLSLGRIPPCAHISIKWHVDICQLSNSTSAFRPTLLI